MVAESMVSKHPMLKPKAVLSRTASVDDDNEIIISKRSATMKIVALLYFPSCVIDQFSCFVRFITWWRTKALFRSIPFTSG